MNLKPYDVREVEGEWSILAFAHTGREALKVAWKVWPEAETRFVDLRATLIRSSDFLFADNADAEKLSRNEAHALDSPLGCSICKRWGKEMEPAIAGQARECCDCAHDRRLDESRHPNPAAKSEGA